MYSSSKEPKGRKATIEELRAATGPVSPDLLDARRSQPKPARGQFVRGPLEWRDICLIARLGPKRALVVWLLVHLRWPLAKGGWINLPKARLEELGVSRVAKSRILQFLAGEGLIRVTTAGKGRTTLVALVRPPSR
jgi:hypothetical protein